MKKLNITKERFEKSRYFQRKYGKLEYVSESGNLFKTSKGKVLMFNEGFFGDLGDALDDGIRGVKKFFHKAKFKKGDKIMVCMADFSPPGVQHGLEVIDAQYGGWSGGWEYKTGTDKWGNPEWWPELRVALDTNPDGGYEEYDPAKFPEFKKLEKYMKKKDSKKEPVDEGTFWPTPESERIPIYTIELIRVDDDGSHDETPMQYQTFYYSDDTAFAAAENLADKFANEDGKFEVHIMAGEYVIDGSTDIYGDPHVDGSIQTGRGWKMVKEGFMSNMGKDGQRLYSIIYRADGWDGSVREYGKSEEDAIQAAIAKGKLDGDEDIVKIVDLGERGEYLESSRKLVKEGAGAGYDVGISDLEIGEVTEVKALDDGDYAFTATIKPGNYEISAESYYDDFFWQEHEWGDTPQAQIDGGVIHGTICPWEDTDDPEEWVRYQVKGNTFNLSFMYGGGWMHSNLPEDGQLYIDEHITITPELYFSIDDIQLDAIDLVQAVNAGYASLDDRYNDEDEDGETMDESYDPKGDDGRKRVMNALEEFRQVLWEDTKVDDEDEHDLRRSLYQDVDNAISQAIQKYFKYSRM